MTSAAPHNAHKQASSHGIEALQPNLMIEILEYANLPEILALASASSGLRRTVYKKSSGLWTHLDFSTLPLTTRARLTDKSLAGLLKRVNAKHVTKTLNLANCANLDGGGLSPLRHSRRLESVDLRRESPNLNEERRAVRELRTMIHHKLSYVRFHQDSMHSNDGCVVNFLRDLHAAKLKQALEKKFKCNACGDAVADESRQLVPNVTGVPPFQCNDCKNVYCLGTACTVHLSICVACGGAKCARCDDNKTIICDACARSYCNECADSSFAKCLGCKEVSCAFCRSVCATCDSTFCSYCVESEGSIFPCFSCNKEYCFQCCEVAMCHDCDQFLCENCLEVKRCGYCSGYFCIKCRDVTSMPNGSGGTVDVCDKCQDKMMELL
jgi:hypothetical protein